MPPGVGYPLGLSPEVAAQLSGSGGTPPEESPTLANILARLNLDRFPQNDIEAYKSLLQRGLAGDAQLFRDYGVLGAPAMGLYNAALYGSDAFNRGMANKAEQLGSLLFGFGGGSEEAPAPGGPPLPPTARGVPSAMGQQRQAPGGAGFGIPGLGAMFGEREFSIPQGPGLPSSPPAQQLPRMDFSTAREALERGRPEEPEKLKSTEKLVSLLAGAARGASIGLKPGQGLGSVLAGAGAGGLGNLQRTMEGQKDREERFEERQGAFALREAGLETGIQSAEARRAEAQAQLEQAAAQQAFQRDLLEAERKQTKITIQNGLLVTQSFNPATQQFEIKSVPIDDVRTLSAQADMISALARHRLSSQGADTSKLKIDYAGFERAMGTLPESLRPYALAAVAIRDRAVPGTEAIRDAAKQRWQEDLEAAGSSIEQEFQLNGGGMTRQEFEAGFIDSYATAILQQPENRDIARQVFSVLFGTPIGQEAGVGNQSQPLPANPWAGGVR